MIELPSRTFVMGTLAFLLCVWLLLFLRLLPISSGFVGWPGPDLTLALVMAWVLRRPDQLSAPVIVLAVMIEDVLLLRPLGLWALIVLLGSEAARRREPRWRDAPFMVEWLRVAILMTGMLLGMRFVQLLFMLPVPALGQVLLQVIATAAAYPLVVFAARWLVGLRRISPAEAL
ncbi:rod shape-determining protein MreD [Paracoccus tibetensis]|jgi:rod shape-determining protein MreD|uniref:Rod shape-determining protein MreD n=1 Tax=Paracoccus tibetensis TaxID=336292 RepID=A0A1G5J9W0_9RHOB|nr:rod shape-determining protein MreD [Paracoccus tibetensis]SCY84984.1 rod shape-determining protein MreD [Paracoccus tibetensis]